MKYICLQEHRIFLKHVIAVVPIETRTVLFKCVGNINISFDFNDTQTRDSFIKNLKNYIYEM